MKERQLTFLAAYLRTEIPCCDTGLSNRRSLANCANGAPHNLRSNVDARNDLGYLAVIYRQGMELSTVQQQLTLAAFFRQGNVLIES